MPSQAAKKAKIPVETKTTYVAAGEFKARCLKLMDEVQAKGGEVVITKRGKPVAKLVQVKERKRRWFGYMKGSMEILGDIMEPVWEWDEKAWLKKWDDLNK